MNVKRGLPPLGLLAALVALPSQTAAAPAAVMLAGGYGRDASGLHGELVRMFVPWSGVNEQYDVLACVTGPFTLANGVLTIQGEGGRVTKLRLNGGSQGTWEVIEAAGPCTGLSGKGDYRITSTPMVRLDGQLELTRGPAPGQPE